MDKYLKKFGFIRVETIWFRRTIPWGEAFYIKKREISYVRFLTKKIQNFIEGVKGYFWIISLLIKLKLIKRDKNTL